MKQLPERLEDRIWSCSVSDVMKVYEMTPGDYVLVEMSAERLLNRSTNHYNFTSRSELYSLLARSMIEKGVLLISDLKIQYYISDPVILAATGTGVALESERKKSMPSPPNSLLGGENQ